MKLRRIFLCLLDRCPHQTEIGDGKIQFRCVICGVVGFSVEYDDSRPTLSANTVLQEKP